MSSYATWTDKMLSASIEDRRLQITSLEVIAKQMVQQFEKAEMEARSRAGHAAIYIGSLDVETFVHGAVDDALTELRSQVREMRYELEERAFAEQGGVAA